MHVLLHSPADRAADPFPFGQSRMLRLLERALAMGGHLVDPVAPGSVAPTALAAADSVIADFRMNPRRVPQLWMSSLVSAQAIDRIGPAVAMAFDIPYVLVQPMVGREALTRDTDQDGQMRAVMTRAVAAILFSSASNEAVRSCDPALAGRSLLLPPLVDLGWMSVARANRPQVRRQLATKLLLRPDVPWLIAAGPMATDRDMAACRLLAQAMSGLAAMPWHLILAGSGGREAEVQAMFQSQPGRSVRHVTIASEGDLHDLLSAGDLFLSSWSGEGAPSTLVEAQAAGLGVVAGKTDDSADVVANGRTGMLIKPDNPASLANAVSFLLRHPDVRRAYAEEAPRWAAMNFDIGRVAARLNSALQDIMRRQGSVLDRPE